MLRTGDGQTVPDADRWTRVAAGVVCTLPAGLAVWLWWTLPEVPWAWGTAAVVAVAIFGMFVFRVREQGAQLRANRPGDPLRVDRLVALMAVCGGVPLAVALAVGMPAVIALDGRPIGVGGALLIAASVGLGAYLLDGILRALTLDVGSNGLSQWTVLGRREIQWRDVEAVEMVAVRELEVRSATTRVRFSTVFFEFEAQMVLEISRRSAS